jgi:hypothetical protein
LILKHNAVGALFGVGLALLVVFAIDHFIEGQADAQRPLAVGVGMAGLIVGGGAAVLCAVLPVKNEGVRRLGIAWGLMGACSGLAIFFWASGHGWLMVMSGSASLMLGRWSRRISNKIIAESNRTLDRHL